RTVQRHTALRLIALVRALRPEARIVVGGYDPSLAPEAYTNVPEPPDFLIRGEGEVTLRELIRAIEGPADYGDISGLSYRVDGGFLHNPDRPVTGLERGQIKPPNRRALVLSAYHMVRRAGDV